MNSSKVCKIAGTKAWIEQESSIMLLAKSDENDPLELTYKEALLIGQMLIDLGNELKNIDEAD